MMALVRPAVLVALATVFIWAFASQTPKAVGSAGWLCGVASNGPLLSNNVLIAALQMDPCFRTHTHRLCATPFLLWLYAKPSTNNFVPPLSLVVSAVSIALIKTFGLGRLY